MTTDPKRDFKISSSNLRMVLEIMRRDLNYGCAQFVWKYTNSNYYLYNLKSHLILASVSYNDSGGVIFIRYRTKGRYGGIIEGWARKLQDGRSWGSSGRYKVVAVPSKHLNDHVRSMRFVHHSDAWNRAQMLRYLKHDKHSRRSKASASSGDQVARDLGTGTIWIQSYRQL